MVRTITVQGANETDVKKRALYLEQLNDQETIVLERLSKLAENPKAVMYLKSAILFMGLEMFLNKK